MIPAPGEVLHLSEDPTIARFEPHVATATPSRTAGWTRRGGIELRVMTNLWPFWDAVITSTLEFSGIRLAKARPRIVPA